MTIIESIDFCLTWLNFIIYYKLGILPVSIFLFVYFIFSRLFFAKQRPENGCKIFEIYEKEKSVSPYKNKKRIYNLLSIFLIGVFIIGAGHYIWFFPREPGKTKLDIPQFDKDFAGKDISKWTFGVRAWDAEVHFKDIEVLPSGLTKWQKLNAPDRWLSVWHENNSKRNKKSIAKYDKNSKTIKLTNCGAIYNISNVIPNNLKYLSFKATIKFIKNDNSENSSCQFCFRVPLTNYNNYFKAQAKKDQIELNQIQNHPETYFALELFRKEPVLSKGWLPNEKTRTAHYDDYVDRFSQLLNKGLYPLKYDQDYELFATFYNSGDVDFKIIKNNNTTLIYHGKLSKNL